MSVEDPGTVDLSKVTPKVVPTKKTPPAKKAAAVRAAAPSAPVDQSAVRAEIEATVRAELEAKIRAEMLAESAATAQYAEDIPVDLNLDETPAIHVEPGEGEVVIHFIDDGFTHGGRIYYRGEELSVSPTENPWVNYPRRLQVERYGKQLFARGPWPYGGFDLTDPELSESDRANLLRVTR